MTTVYTVFGNAEPNGYPKLFGVFDDIFLARKTADELIASNTISHKGEFTFIIYPHKLNSKESLMKALYTTCHEWNSKVGKWRVG